MTPRALAVLALSLAACSSTPSDPWSAMRGQRYCEILAGGPSGANVELDVYNTYALDDCPQAAWAAVDTSQVMSQLGVAVVRLNGPRYWVQDALHGMAADPTVVNVGGLDMRKAAHLSVPLAMAANPQPYTPRTVNRTTTTLFRAGQPVYELVDPAGRVSAMQSFSVQQDPSLKQSDLAGLGARLQLPTGWTFRTRTLDADLTIVADGAATVTQDELINTYILETP